MQCSEKSVSIKLILSLLLLCANAMFCLFCSGPIFAIGKVRYPFPARSIILFIVAFTNRRSKWYLSFISHFQVSFTFFCYVSQNFIVGFVGFGKNILVDLHPSLFMVLTFRVQISIPNNSTNYMYHFMILIQKLMSK